MNVIDEHIKNIINANNNNRLAIFVGSGISKTSETAILKSPDWKELIKKIEKDLDITEENDFLKIAQLFYLEFGEYTYYEKLKSYFPDNLEPSIVHKLIFSLKPHCIITTNWDNILETTIRNNAYIYDIVCSDSDLIKSTIEKKMIKMHGDLKNHNIVFKEDDYLNYHLNFPIIENYIKSILSTHTVLFVGYSYNDINLKQIIKWIQFHSSVKPPMYLTASKEKNKKNSQEKYLENYGIKILLLEDESEKYRDLNTKSNKIATFLDKLITGDKAFINTCDKDSIVEYVYNKLQILNSLDSILLEQIQQILPIYRFIYTDDFSIVIEFSKKEEIFELFIDILSEYPDKYENDKMLKIIEILTKANIDGIVLSQNKKEYIPFNQFIKRKDDLDVIENYFNFDFNNVPIKNNKINLAYKYYNLKEYEKAYNYIEESIELYLKQKDYPKLFLAMFNRNLLLSRLKDTLYASSFSYEEIEKYDLKERLDEMPKDIRKALEPIYDFISFNFLYRNLYRISDKLKDKEDSKRIIENGGWVYSSNITESYSKQNNLLFFVILNEIMIDNYKEFKTIHEYFIKISLTRQINKDFRTLKKIELFSCIKYLNKKDLEFLLEDCYHSDSSLRGKFQISDEDKEWLIEKVLKNLVDLYIKLKTPFNNYNNNLENAIFILSLVNLNSNQLNKIMNLFLEIFLNGRNTIAIYESVNQFLGIQYNLYKQEINKEILNRIIETIIYKLSYRSYNGYDYFAITENRIYYIYQYAIKYDSFFTNKDLINKLIFELNNSDIEEKIKISGSVLLNIYDISNEEIKNIIKDFILKFDFSKNKYIDFELFLIIKEFKEVDNNVIEKLKNYVSKSNNKNILDNLKEQINYLVNEKKYKQ
ncbi:MAG: hypothetical protein A2086_10140, partial [Spirochaetes bacterium GWD1_27_9]